MDYEKDNRLNEIIETALKNLNTLIDVNTVIGKPLQTNKGDYIIPVSKVTFGVLAGGGEYGKISFFKKDNDLPYSAGNGAIVSIKPCAFLVRDKNENYKIMSVSNGAYDTILEKTGEILNDLKIKGEVN